MYLIRGLLIHIGTHSEQSAVMEILELTSPISVKMKNFILLLLCLQGCSFKNIEGTYCYLDHKTLSNTQIEIKNDGSFSYKIYGDTGPLVFYFGKWTRKNQNLILSKDSLLLDKQQGIEKVREAKINKYYSDSLESTGKCILRFYEIDGDTTSFVGAFVKTSYGKQVLDESSTLAISDETEEIVFQDLYREFKYTIDIHEVYNIYEFYISFNYEKNYFISDSIHIDTLLFEKDRLHNTSVCFKKSLCHN